MQNAADIISVVMPVYNTAKYLPETIHSIINHDYKNLELIVADDGSTDGSPAVLESLRPACEARFLRAHFETRPHGGAGAALAYAASLARGEYLFIMDSDDILKPGALQALKTTLDQAPGCALVFGDGEIIDQDGRPAALNEYGLLYQTGDKKRYERHLNFLRSISHGVDFDSPDFGSYQSLFSGNYTCGICLISHSAYKAVGGVEPEPELLAKDWHMALKISREYKMKYIENIIFAYRRHPQSEMAQRERMLKSQAQTFEWLRLGIEARNLDWEQKLFSDFVASRTTRLDFFRLGSFIHLYGERFGLGDYYATRRLILKICGRRVYQRFRRYLGGHDGLSLCRSWNPHSGKSPQRGRA